MADKLTMINPPGLHPTSGYAHVTIAAAGRTAHLAGLCPLDENEAVVGLGDLEDTRLTAVMRTTAAVFGLARKLRPALGREPPEKTSTMPIVTARIRESST